MKGWRFTNNVNEIKLLEADELRASVNHRTGEQLAGLAVFNHSRKLVVQTYGSYFTYCYRVSGQQIGFGPDHNPLLDISTLRVLSPMLEIKSEEYESWQAD